MNRGLVLRVNGREVVVDVDPRARLLDVLRESLHLTGTKEGCGEGECGACTVLVDGEPVCACLVPTFQVEGRDVVTVEGIEGDTALHSVQEAFVSEGGVQCGACTPGFVVAAKALLDRDPRPSRAAMAEAFAGNLCRCTGYERIFAAVAKAGATARSSRPSDRASGPAAPASEPDAGPSGGPPAWCEAASCGSRLPPVLRPRSVAEAVAALAAAPEPLSIVAGGTDLVVRLHATNAALGRVLDLSTVPELRAIIDEGPRLLIGAAVTYSMLRDSAPVVAGATLLAAMAGTVGGWQIQNRGTLGGNVANASPAGDALPVLLALEAEAEIVGPEGMRLVPLREFFVAYRRTVLGPRDLLVRFRVPKSPSGRFERYLKVGARAAQAISKVVLALVAEATGGALAGVRLAAGSVAPVPLRLVETERLLEGAMATPELAERAGSSAAREIAPIDDLRSTAAYRRGVVARLVRRFVLDAAARP